MIANIAIACYGCAFLITLSHYLYLLNDANEDLGTTRSREMKVVLRKRVTRYEKNISLSVVWPYLVAYSVYSAISSRQKLKDGK